MKILDISHISTGVAMPLKSGSIQFIQDAAREALAGLFSNLIPNPLPNKLYVISGVRNIDTALNYLTITAGYIFLNGEIFQVDTVNFSTLSLQVYASIITTQFLGIGGNADPVNFSDGSQDSVHDIRKITFIPTNTAPNTIPDNPHFEDIIYIDDPKALIGDTKEIVCDSTYMSNNFDSTGKALATSERRGWAIMNGNNGTPNDNGRVVIAQGTTYSSLEVVGGSPDAILVSHTHTMGGIVGNSSGGSGHPTIGADGSGGTPVITDSSGISGTGKNMQPYVVRLRIMKITYNS